MDTLQSLPPTSRAPASWRLRNGYCQPLRSGPRNGIVRSRIWASQAAQNGCMFAPTSRAAKRGTSAGWTTWMWATWGRRSAGPLRRRTASTASRPERTARSPIAWKWSWKPAASSAGAISPARRAGSMKSMPGVGRRPPVAIEVRLEEGAREVLEDAVEHELDRRSPQALDDGCPPRVLEPLELVQAARPVPPQREGRAQGEVAALGEGPVGRNVVLLDPGVRDGGDPEGVEVPLGGEDRRLPLPLVERRKVAADESGRSLVKRPLGRSVGLALDPAIVGIGRGGRDAGEREGPAVDPRPVAVAVLQEDRSVRDDRVEVRPRGSAAWERRHAPPAADDPRLVRMGDRVRRDRCEVRLALPGQVVEVAGQERPAAERWVDVGILEARQERSALEVDHARRPAREPRRSRSSPTAAIRPWRTASAVAARSPGCIVRTAPLTNSTSAGWSAREPAPAPVDRSAPDSSCAVIPARLPGGCCGPMIRAGCRRGAPLQAGAPRRTPGDAPRRSGGRGAASRP